MTRFGNPDSYIKILNRSMYTVEVKFRVDNDVMRTYAVVNSGADATVTINFDIEGKPSKEIHMITGQYLDFNNWRALNATPVSKRIGSSQTYTLLIEGHFTAPSMSWA